MSYRSSQVCIRLVNLPWEFTTRDLRRYFLKSFNAKIDYARIFYNKENGLSRGIALAKIENPDIAADIIRRGFVEIDDRSVVVSRYAERQSNNKTENITV